MLERPDAAPPDEVGRSHETIGDQSRENRTNGKARTHEPLKESNPENKDTPVTRDCSDTVAKSYSSITVDLEVE